MPVDKQLVIFGAGGHGRVVADIAIQQGCIFAGFVDDRAGTCELEVPPNRILGNRAWLCNLPQGGWHVALGIGDNYARRSVVQFLTSVGIEIATIVSPSAVVSPSARIGTGTVIMPGAVLNSAANIGEGVIINTGALVEHDTRVGNYAHLSPNSTLGGGASIGELAHIALGAIVLPNIRIGDRSVLGAGSVATRTIPDDAIAFGIPARVKRSIEFRQDE